jgi:hypothetical protein
MLTRTSSNLPVRALVPIHAELPGLNCGNEDLFVSTLQVYPSEADGLVFVTSTLLQWLVLAAKT